jgi:hypothetical protein
MFRMLTPLHADRNNIEATLTAIQEALNTHFIVGLTERFEESLVLFKRVGLLDSIDFNKHKVIHDRLRWNDLTVSFSSSSSCLFSANVIHVLYFQHPPTKGKTTTAC